MNITTALGNFSVPNVTRTYAGTYTSIVTNTLESSSTVSATSTVVIQSKLNFFFKSGFTVSMEIKCIV